MYKPTSPLNNNITDTIGRALDNDRHEHEHEHEHEHAERRHEHEGNHRNDTTVLIQAVILAVLIAGLHVLRF